MVYGCFCDGVKFKISGDSLEISGGSRSVTVHKRLSRSAAVTDVEIFSLPAESLQLGSGDGVYDIYCQKRMKGDMPGCVRSDECGENFDMLAENGVITADSVMMLRSGNRILLAGFLQLHRHLGRIEWSSAGLRAVAEYNAEYLASETEICTQDVIFLTGSDPNELLAEYAETVSREYDLPQKPRFPRYTVGANWHYYGPTMTQHELEDELACIVRRGIRMDVYQLDDGWQRDYGNWHPNGKFPDGMKSAADAIRNAGMIPGIWVTPFLCGNNVAAAEEHPEWLLRDGAGNEMTMQIGNLFFRVFDPSHPGFRAWITGELRNIYQWGYRYFKVDFCRCLFINPQARPYDRSLTLLELYRLGISIIREAVGEDSCLNICGGHEASIRLADISRSGSDTYGVWKKDGGVWRRIRQCVMRSYLNRFRWNDPDASVLRLNDVPLSMDKDFTPHRKDGGYSVLPLGSLSDDEARTMMLNQFLGGGIIESGECFASLPEKRLEMLNFMIPAWGETVKAVDFFHAGMPRFYRSVVKPRCAALPEWEIVSVVNVSDEILCGKLPFAPEKDTLVYDILQGRELAVVKAGEHFTLPETSPHASQILKFIPLPENGKPFFAASTLHISGGGAEILQINVTETEISGEIDNPLCRQCTLAGAFPREDGSWHIVNVPFAGSGHFLLKKSAF